MRSFVLPEPSIDAGPPPSHRDDEFQHCVPDTPASIPIRAKRIFGVVVTVEDMAEDDLNSPNEDNSIGYTRLIQEWPKRKVRSGFSG